MKTASHLLNGKSFLMKALLIAIIFISASYSRIQAADYYWVGGTGNWSDYANHWATTSGGTIFHTAIPSLNDNVYFDANSFTAPGQSVTFDNTFIYCNNMDWTGVTNDPWVNGLASKLNVYGSLTLVPDMNWSVKRIDFAGTTINLQLTSAGLPLDTLYFLGSGSYNLADELNAISIYIHDGTFSSNNFDITVKNFIAGLTGNTITVDLGTSLITCSDLFKTFDGTINLTAANTDLLFTNNYPIWNFIPVWINQHEFRNVEFGVRGELIGGITCQRLVAATTFYINGSAWTTNIGVAEFYGATRLSCTYNGDSISVMTPGTYFRMRQLNLSSYLSVVGTCGQPINIQPDDFQPSGTINMGPAANVNIDYCIITSINAVGGASFLANNSVDAGGNNGWTINSSVPRTLYWVGGTGNWNDENSWALVSGGAAGNCIPSAIDHVIFDSNSFTQPGDSVKLNGVQASCRDMDWSAATNSPVFAYTATSNLFVHGSVTLNPSMNLSFNSFDLVGGNTGNTFTSAGLPIGRITVNGTGTWSMLDPLNTNSIQIYKGTWNTNSFDITATAFSANGIGNSVFVDLGSSTLNLSEYYVAFDPAVTINSTNANLIFYNNTGTIIYGQLSNATFNEVTVNAYTYFSGKLTCNNFTSNSGVRLEDLYSGSARFYQSFQADSLEADSIFMFAPVQQVSFMSMVINDDLQTFTNCNQPISITGSSTGPATIFKSGGTIDIQYAYLKKIAASGGAVFNANNCWDLGNNSGWNFTTPAARDLYWVGGAGEWDDPSHWSLTSNGTPGNCPPTLTDNIFFDSNSIAAAGQTININPSLIVYCNNLSFAGIPAGTVLMTGSNSPINVNGSVALVPELDPWALGLNMISSNTGNTIHTGNNNIYDLRTSGSGEWSLLSNINAGNIYLQGGTFNSNSYNITTGGINTGGNTSINFGSSNISLLGFYSQSPSVIIDGDSANVTITSSVLSFRVYNTHFNSVTFTGDANTQLNFSCNRLVANGNFVNINSQITAGHALFKNDVTLSLPFIADTLVFDNPGDLVKINQLTINDTLISNGSAGFPVQIEGYNGSGTLTKTGGVVCLDHVLLKDINATGGAQFFAGGSSVDLGGNTGWVFGPCSPVTFVWPGDANYDLTADNFDILNIGLAYGYSGPVRAGATLNWVAQPAQDWLFQFANGANLKHADTDGSGFVDNDDTLAVSLNYGLTHPFRLMYNLPSSLPSPLLYVVANPDTASLSDTISVDVFLGESTLPVDSIYGIAFTLNFDTAMVESNYLTVDFSQCWMGTSQVDLITFHRDLLVDGKVDMAIVRNDQQNITGFGKLAQIGVVVVDNVGAKVTMPVYIDQVKAITASEYLLTIATSSDSVVIDTAGTVGINEPETISLTMHPNPANTFVQLQSGTDDVLIYEIYDLSGRLLTTATPRSRMVRIDTSVYTSGGYFIRIVTSKGSAVKRFDVLHR